MESRTAIKTTPSVAASVAVVVGGVALLAASVAAGLHTRLAVVALLLGMSGLLAARIGFVSWPRMLAALILIILFIPIRRYALPGNLPFQLEPYRLFVGLLIVAWIASLLVDPRTRLRRTGFEAPLMVIISGVGASVIANPERVATASGQVDKSLMFFLSFLLVMVIVASVVRRLESVDFIVRTLVTGGAVVALFAIVEARIGLNVFNYLDRFVPGLTPTAEVGGFQKFGTARLRVFGSAQHPIALSAALVMVAPLAVYLATRHRQRRWVVCAVLLGIGCASTISRTGILMLVVGGVVLIWLRPVVVRRFWPAVVVVPVLIHLFLPGTLGAIKHSFFPAGGLIAEQSSMPGGSGSGRLADLGPALEQWTRHPLVGVGFATRNVEERSAPGQANVLDNQWLGTLLDTGAIGVVGWLWLFGRAAKRFGAEARRDDSARGWLLVSIAAAVVSYAVGMFTYDAFSFVQVTFLLFIFLGLGAAVLAERPIRLNVERRGAAPSAA